MAELPRLMIAVLAAGQSRRFGSGDKLVAPFRGKPLGLHVTDTLGVGRSGLEAEARVVIAADDKHVCAGGWNKAGFAVVRNPSAAEGMGTSVATAARIARRGKADHLLLALADMPLVPPMHYSALAERGWSVGSTAIVASSNGEARMPPAVFGSDHFDTLTELDGDSGARTILGQGEVIECVSEWLVDIDTPEALAELN